VVKRNLQVNWEDEAKIQLKQACNYIKKDSIKNAQKVKKDILTAVTSLSLNPEKYPADKFKFKNDGSFRAFELHHYRIVYRIIQTEIKILRVRHAKMEPVIS
jgi:plasmid stabilization system protein ParE